jgi:hypothetical protein
MGPYAGVDYNLTLYPLQSQLQHIYHWQPYARVDRNPMPETTLSPSQGLWIRPLRLEFQRITAQQTQAHGKCVGVDMR